MILGARSNKIEEEGKIIPAYLFLLTTDEIFGGNIFISSIGI